MIDTSRLTQTSYCVLVLWLTGRFSTRTIARNLDVSEGIVKAACRERDRGGVMPKRRSYMTFLERQALLTHLRHTRLDRGRLQDQRFFSAVPIKHEPEEPVEVPDTSTRAGKKRMRELAHENQVMRDAERREKVEREDGGAARGVDAVPLEWLNRERLLRDPETLKKGDLDKSSEEMRRYESGVRLRSYFEASELNGFKEVDLGKVGSASLGMSIPERLIMALSSLEAIQGMMAASDYRQIVAVVREDEFIWDSIPTKTGREIIFEDIRRALDVTALFVGMMDDRAFEARWGTVPIVRKAKSREDAREVVRTARSIIAEGVRQ